MPLPDTWHHLILFASCDILVILLFMKILKRTKIPSNKSVITNKPRKNIKIILIQKHSFFNGKNKMITTLHWWIEKYKGNYNKFPMLFSIFIICYCPTIYMLVTRSKEIIILTKLNGHTTQMDRNSFYPFGFR